MVVVLYTMTIGIITSTIINKVFEEALSGLVLGSVRFFQIGCAGPQVQHEMEVKETV